MAKPKKPKPEHDETDLKNRALAAYWRSGRPGEKLAPPSPDRVTVAKARGRYYVLVRGADGALLMSYRVRNDGKLKRLVRIPHELKDEET